MAAWTATVCGASVRPAVRNSARARWISPVLSQKTNPCRRPMSRTSSARRPAVSWWPPTAYIQAR